MSTTAARLQPGGAFSPPEFELFVAQAEAGRAWVAGYFKHMLGLEPARVSTPRDFPRARASRPSSSVA